MRWLLRLSWCISSALGGFTFYWWIGKPVDWVGVAFGMGLAVGVTELFYRWVTRKG